MRKIILSFAACLALAAYGQKPVQDTRAMDTFIDQLMGKMTLDEKIGQLNLSGGGVPGILSGSEGADETIRRGWLGATGGSELETFRKLQEIAVKESRLGIPLLFGLDVIHGYHTIFPIPLALSCSWDTTLIEQSARIAAIEASSNGVTWTYSLVREKEKKAKRRSISVRWGRYASATAAFLAGLVFAGGIAWGLLSNKLSDYTVMTTGGQRAQTVLPDGSKVWLNASTKLIYRNSFWSTDRQIDLSGEAYFEVARDKHAPFIVNTKHIKTCVLGTKFNVRAREEEDRVVTTLLQGSVRMESPRTVNNGYLLKPGQTLNINTTTYQAELIEYAEPTEVLLWINGKLKFKQHSLLEITNIMEKLYDLKFVYDDESLKTERFTGEFSTDNLPDEILNVLMHTNHFSYKKEGRIIRLSKK